MQFEDDNPCANIFASCIFQGNGKNCQVTLLSAWKTRKVTIYSYLLLKNNACRFGCFRICCFRCSVPCSDGIHDPCRTHQPRDSNLFALKWPPKAFLWRKWCLGIRGFPRYTILHTYGSFRQWGVPPNHPKSRSISSHAVFRSWSSHTAAILTHREMVSPWQCNWISIPKNPCW